MAKKNKNEFISNDILDKANALHATREEVKKAENNLMDDVITTLKKFMKETKYFEAIRWHQYTPGFNDGDPCLFSIGELEVLLVDNVIKEFKNEEVKAKEEDEEDDEEGEWLSSYDIEQFVKKNIDVLTHDEIGAIERQYEAVNTLWGILTDMDSRLQDKFGDSKEITVTKTGIEIEDYDCGY